MRAGLVWLLLAGGAVAAIMPIREVPYWEHGGAHTVSGRLLPEAGTKVLDSGSITTIAIEGDSNVLANRLALQADGARSPAFGDVMERLSGSCWRVESRGAGGDTAATGRRRWRGAAGTSDLVILVYGDNDAAPRGPLARRRPVPVSAYEWTMRALIRRHHMNGSRVLVLGPMASGSAAMAGRLDPYRHAARRAAVAEGAAFLDVRAAFAACRDEEPLLNFDAAHLNARGQACVGRWLYARLSSHHPTSAAPPASGAS